MKNSKVKTEDKFDQITKFYKKDKTKTFLIVDRKGNVKYLNTEAKNFFGFKNVFDAKSINVDYLLPGLFDELKKMTIYKKEKKIGFKNFYATNQEGKSFAVKLKFGNLCLFNSFFFVVYIYPREVFGEIEEAQDLFQYLISHSKDIVLFKYDMNMIVEWISPNCEYLTGYTQEEILGKDCSNFFDEEISRQYYKILHEHHKIHRKISSFGALCRKKDGTKLWIKFLLSLRPSINGAYKGICLAANIDTAIKIKDAIESSKLLNDKNDILSIWTEDIKAPIKNINKYLELALAEKDLIIKETYLKKALNSSKNIEEKILDKKNENFQNLKTSNLAKRKNDYFDEEGYILAAEEEGTDQMILMAYLSKLGYHNFEVLDNSLAALDRLQNKSSSQMPYLSNKKPIIFLCDHHLIPMKGDKIIQNYLKYTKENNIKTIPLIAFSADGTKENKEKFIKSGADEVIVKPLTLESLQRVLLKYIGPPNKKL